MGGLLNQRDAAYCCRNTEPVPGGRPGSKPIACYPATRVTDIKTVFKYS